MQPFRPLGYYIMEDESERQGKSRYSMDMEHLSEYIKEVKRGRKEHYLPIVELFEPRIRAFVASRCYDRNMIDELVQDVFIFAYQKISEYEDDTNFQGWLYAIARVKVLDELKRKAQKAQAHNKYADYILADHALAGMQTVDDMDFERNSKALALCLEKVSDVAREFIDMKYKKNMNLNEICSFFNRSETWAKSFFFRLKLSLRKCIQERITGETAYNETT